MKERTSITIDSDIKTGIEKQATEESRSFSSMVQHMAKKYLMALKKPKSGGKK